MSTYNKKSTKNPQARATSPVKTASEPTGTTFEGHPGYAREAKSELFLAASTTFMKQDAFYESAKKRDNRIVALTRQVATEDPVWLLRCTRWLRREANMRAVSLVLGLEAARAVLDHVYPSLESADRGLVPTTHPDLNGQGIARNLAKAGILRPDEPGEALGYWTDKYGNLDNGTRKGSVAPRPIKRAIADMATALYNERSLLKYDTDSHGFRFGDVIELTGPDVRAPWQSDLFKYAIDRRHGNEEWPGPSSLAMVQHNQMLRTDANENPGLLLVPENLRRAGMTWEDALSLAGSKVDKRLLWEAMIPNMGYMALLRNLRNFDQAEVDNLAGAEVAQRLADPDQVARSRQLPFRFLSALQGAPSLRWGWALEQALNHSLMNIPELSGRTLILVDTSGSMDSRFSTRGTMKRWDMAAVFGIALARGCESVDLVSFSGSGYMYQQAGGSTYRATKQFPLQSGGSVLSEWKRWQDEGFNLNGGTDTIGALRTQFRNHDRVVLITDEQSHFYGHRNYWGAESSPIEVNDAVPANVPMHIINVAGYELGSMPSGTNNRHVYGGLTDQVFKLIPLVEAGAAGQWPWEQEQ